MRLSTRGRYAVRLMVEVDRQGRSGAPVQLTKIAKATGISRRYLEQLVIALKSHALLRGVSGRKGGYVLAKSASKITVGDVLEAVIGPVNLLPCLEQPDNCKRVDACDARIYWTLLNLRITEVLDEYTIADLSNKQVLATIRETVFGKAPPQKVTAGIVDSRILAGWAGPRRRPKASPIKKATKK